MTFDPEQAGIALRKDGLDLAPDTAPRALGNGKWRVQVIGRMQKDEAGERTVVLKGGKWSVER